LTELHGSVTLEYESEVKTLDKKRCPVCLAEFTQQVIWQKYCSEGCKFIAYGQRKKKKKKK
jgi:predicted nucleic acid-binding Zn ribbon protein